MPSIEFEVWCDCGNGLCNSATVESGRHGPKMTLEPCEKCLEKKRQEVYDDGYSDGEDKGYEKGYEEGRDKGYEEGLEEGYNKGKEEQNG